MTTYTWKADANGTWTTSSNWSPSTGYPSNSGDIADITATGSSAYTVTLGSSETINNLVITSASSTASTTLALASSITLTMDGATSLGSDTYVTLASNDIFNAGNLTASAGSTIDLASGAALRYAGSSTLGGTIDGTATSSIGSILAGVTVNGLIEATGGVVTVGFSQISGSGTLEANGGTLNVAGSLANDSGGATALGVISASSSSVYEYTGASYYSATFSAQFLGAAGEYQYNSAYDGHVNFNVAGLNVGSSTTVPTNFVDLPETGVTVSSGGTGTGATGTVTLSNGDVLKLTGITNNSGGWKVVTENVDGTTEVFLTVCYAAGTRILTAAGESCVEALVPGDLVMTLAGEELQARPVQWIGRRRIDLAAHPHPETVMPVRIRQGAFADNLPHRDLLVSPDHAIFVDGMLIAAHQLINGATILQENNLETVEYFHVELDRHAILLAEGLPSESYLDCGNRGFFANADAPLTLHPDLTREAANPLRAVAACHPFAFEEARVRPVWQRLAARAELLDQALPTIETVSDPGLMLRIKDRVVRPLHTEGGLAIFALPKGTVRVHLLSRVAAPSDSRPWLNDRRQLGVKVRKIMVRGPNDAVDVSLDNPGLSEGWWDLEHDGVAEGRWTSGDALMRLPNLKSAVLLEIQVASTPAYILAAEDTREAA